jgi:hypothetical protein
VSVIWLNGQRSTLSFSQMVYKMTSNRVAFASALGLAVLALFILNGAKAAEFVGTPTIIPNDSRVDGNQDMNFAIEFDEGDGVTNLVIKVWFDAVDEEYLMTCTASCVGDSGIYNIVPDELIDIPLAKDLVALVGDDEIAFGFTATYDEGRNDWPGEGDNCIPGTNCDAVRVNTIPVLSDNATVIGGGMPEDTYTLTITYTDDDGHPGIVTATVCDEDGDCDDNSPFTLEWQEGLISSGAVYGLIDFSTMLGGTLTVIVSATDSYDPAEDNRTTTFSVDTTTPWLKNPSVSPTSAGEDDNITFSVIYCVFDESTTGASVTVAVDAGDSAMESGAGSSFCKNGVIYSLTSTVPWSGTSQAVTFSASNDVADATDLVGPSLSINDVPTLAAGTAERHFNGVDFVFNVTASDVNSDDGDTITVYATIEVDTEKEMTCDDVGSCTLTVAESTIIDQMGGERSVTFRVVDSWGDESSDAFGQTIDVTKTSNFVMVDPADGSFQPGFGDYDFTITNSGNYADTFTISATSDNGWVGSYDDTVTVGKDATETFTITMDVPNAAAGIVDHWSMAITAGNDVSQTDSHEGTTTVLFKSGVSVSIGTDAGSALPSEDVTYHFVITNEGNGDETFSYSTTSGNNWGLAVTGNSVTLAMGASETVVVTHTVHEDAGAGDTDTITFNAGGGFPDGAGGTATTTADQTYGASISFGTSNQGSTLNPGDSFTISYTVTNGGNGNDAFSVFFDAPWMTASSGTALSLAAGVSGTATATITVPSDTPSESSSTIAAHVTGGGGSSDDAGLAYTITVSSDTRSASITGESGYTINRGDTDSGTVTITNTGVAADFAVTSASDSLSFDSSALSLGAGQSGTLTFTIHAVATGDVSFTVSNAIDSSADISHTFAITAREFNLALLTTNTDDCGNAGITCVTDAAGGFNNGEYTNAGTFFTTMTATDANGMTGKHTFFTTIENAAPSVTVPMAPAGTIAQDVQSFSFVVPTDRDGTITQLVIAWGDGSKFTFDSSALAGKSAVATTHEYAEPGEKTITVTAYDNSGDSTIQITTIEVGERTEIMGDNSYLYNLVFLIGFFLLGAVLTGTSFKMLQGEIAGDKEMNDRDRQRLESVERRMESLSEREELLEVSAYDASRAATKLEEHISAFNEILVKAQEIAAEEKLKELEAAEDTKQKEEEQMQLDLEDPDIEMVAERFHDALGRLVNARGELSKIEEQLAYILKMERDEQLEKLTEMTESYETTKRKIDALQTSAEARDAAAVENNIMNLLSAAASGGSVGGADFGDFGDSGGDDEYEVEIYEDEDGSFYYIDPDTGEEVPCDENGNAL